MKEASTYLNMDQPTYTHNSPSPLNNGNPDTIKRILNKVYED